MRSQDFFHPALARCFLALSLGALAASCEDLDAIADGGTDGGIVLPDAGTVFDAGGPQLDAGVFVPSDAGVTPNDAGGDGALPTDAGGDATLPGDAAADAGAPNTSLCKLHGYEVAMIGDSYINLTSFASVLADVTHKAGALPMNETYVDHSLSGASMDGFPNIPAQWPDALAAAKARGAQKIKLTIMTGGGNDVLVNNRYCLDFPTQADVSAQCKTVVDTAIKRGQELMDQATKDGVEHVIYFFYPHLPKGGIGGGPYPNTILDYALPKVKAFCDSQTKVPCTFVDLVPAFDDGTGFAREGLINIDGIHPTGTGTQLMADVIWKVMQDNCLASQAP